MKDTIFKICTAVIVSTLLLSITIGCISLIYHEKSQDKQIDDLHVQLDLLTQETSDSDTDTDSVAAYKYLAIGNSITKHATCDYWWNKIGMAATKADKDYVHLIAEYLNSVYGTVDYDAYNFLNWELQSADRAETLSLIDKYLSDELDLITVQLSENMSNVTTFHVDYVELINYIKERCPNTEIILIDDFWSDEKSDMKKAVAEEMSLKFASLSEIRNLPEYQCGLNTWVYDENGEPHIVQHSGVAKHPGDKGMAYIATTVIELLK